MIALSTIPKFSLAAGLTAAVLWAANPDVVLAPTHEPLSVTTSSEHALDPFACPICGGGLEDFRAMLGWLYDLNGRLVLQGGGLGLFLTQG